MSETNEYITDALYRIISNDQDLYNGARYACMSGYVEGYVESENTPSNRQIATDHYATARVWAMDALREYIVEVVFEEEGDRAGEYVTRTLAAAALDLVDWRNLSRHILQSIAESTDGYYQMSAADQEAATLAVCRQYVAGQEGESE